MPLDNLKHLQHIPSVGKELFSLCLEPCGEVRHKVLHLLHCCILFVDLVLHAHSL